MNERIKQLAVEAGMIVGEPNGFDMTRLMPKEVKFAELIVQKCMSFQDEAGVYSKFDMADAIAQHFGVKE